MYQIEWLAVGTASTVALLLIGHWMRCPRPLSRLWRYVYGVTAICVGFSIWRLVGYGDVETVAGLVVIAVTGGLATFAAYGWDAVVTAIHKAEKAESADESLKD